MYSFNNLSDYDFEALCSDVLSRVLGVQLYYFGPGCDRGIDLTDNVATKNIVVQVKHYANSSESSVITALKKEVVKMDSLIPKPNDYYVCCSRSLSNTRQEEIYSLFNNYMKSPNNTYDYDKIDNFLQENSDVVEKHFKLWMVSSNVLNLMLNRNIFIDSEFLKSSINSHKDIYVQTKAYNDALKYLDKRNVLLIVGDPGVGKTITSEMIVLKYLGEGYHIRYTTDISDLRAIKDSLSANEEANELVLLDDCFGQAYYKMKESQTNELVSLIKYVSLRKNKKLIMNSRVTIYNQAKSTRSLQECEERKEYLYYTLDLNEQPDFDKALILYNHLYFNDVGSDYLADIKKYNNYYKIIKHANYSPRIIEYATKKKNIDIIDADKFAEHIIGLLDNPNEVWLDEFEIRIKKEDRALLETLYSLTDTTVNEELLRKCYNSLISIMGLDTSLNLFRQSVERLNDSMIRIIDDKGVRKYSVANPSLNDFLRKYLTENDYVVSSIIKNAKSVHQLRRLIDDDTLFEHRIKSLFKDFSILSFEFDNEQQENGFITYFCSRFNILDEQYSRYIRGFFDDLSPISFFGKQPLSFYSIFDSVFQIDFCRFYGLCEILTDDNKLSSIISRLDLEECVCFINSAFAVIDLTHRAHFSEKVREELLGKIESEYDYVEVSDCGFDVSEILNDYRILDDDGLVSYDVYGAAEELETLAKSIHIDWIKGVVSKIIDECAIDSDSIGDLYFHVEGGTSIVESHLYAADDDDDDFRGDSFNERSRIDRLFDSLH